MSGMNFSVATPCEKAPNSFSVIERGMTTSFLDCKMLDIPHLKAARRTLNSACGSR